MALTCPQCNSERIQKYSLIHRKGISDIDVTTVEAGSFLEASKSKGQSMSKLAQDCAPPKKMSYVVPMILIFLLFGVLIAIVGANFFSRIINFLCLVCLVAYPFFAFSYNRKEFPRQIAKWNRRFLCLVCEHTFEVGHGEQDSNPKIRKTFSPSR